MKTIRGDVAEIIVQRAWRDIVRHNDVTIATVTDGEMLESLVEAVDTRFIDSDENGDWT